MTNPYESPHQTSLPRRGLVRRRDIKLWHWVTLAYPLLMVAGIFCTWVTAWLALGHLPRPSIDDPGQIHALVDVVYALSGMLIVATPAGFLLGLVAMLSLADPLRRLLGTVTLILLWLAAFAMIRLEPWRIIEWYMD